LGPEALTDAELLAILVAPGTAGNPAERIAENILRRFGSVEGLAGQPLEKLYEIKGMGDTKIIRLAAALEIARARRLGHPRWPAQRNRQKVESANAPPEPCLRPNQLVR
jgi:DNA repair protein RadC